MLPYNIYVAVCSPEEKLLCHGSSMAVPHSTLPKFELRNALKLSPEGPWHSERSQVFGG